MATKAKPKPAPTDISSAGLTAQQQKWFASVREGLARDTGKTLEQWAEIARKCPETKTGARVKWLKEKHGLGVNRAAAVLDAAFGGDNMGWDDPKALVAALWKNPAHLKIHDALVDAISKLDGAIIGERQTFTGFSRKYQIRQEFSTQKLLDLLGLPLHGLGDAEHQFGLYRHVRLFVDRLADSSDAPIVAIERANNLDHWQDIVDVLSKADVLSVDDFRWRSYDILEKRMTPQQFSAFLQSDR